VLFSPDLKSTVLVTLLLGVAAAPAQQPDQKPTVRHLIGLEDIKRNASGQLTVQSGVLQFKGNKSEAQIPASTIDDIFVGSETTQGGGKTGRVVRTAAMAAPYGTGRLMTLVLRTKVDVLTVSYHATGGGQHGAIFALPKGQAQILRDQLVQAGAHTSPVVAESAQKESKP
jgi:hypothetical protein